MAWTANWPGASFKDMVPGSIYNGSLAHAVEPYTVASNQMYVGCERPIWGYFVDQVEATALDSSNEAASVKVVLPPFASYLELGLFGRWDKVSGTSRIVVACTETSDTVAAAGLNDENGWYILSAVNIGLPDNQPRAILARNTATYPLDRSAGATLTLSLSNAILLRAYWRVIPPAGAYSVP